MPHASGGSEVAVGVVMKYSLWLPEVMGSQLWFRRVEEDAMAAGEVL